MTDCVGTAHILNVVLAVITVKSVILLENAVISTGLVLHAKTLPQK